MKDFKSRMTLGKRIEYGAFLPSWEIQEGRSNFLGRVLLAVGLVKVISSVL